MSSFVTFKQIRKRHQVVRFMYTHIAFLNKNILPIPILQTLNSNAEETAQNKQNTFLLLKMSLKIKFDNHQRPGRTKLLKLLHPTLCTVQTSATTFCFFSPG
jgi:hypothetical protein